MFSSFHLKTIFLLLTQKSHSFFDEFVTDIGKWHSWFPRAVGIFIKIQSTNQNTKSPPIKHNKSQKLGTACFGKNKDIYTKRQKIRRQFGSVL